ncbi:MAG: hypothetical protein ACK5V5_00490 [Cyclobacteriaceae bacterium]|nr:hypothetical protein [Flammeovirgaceae bacterium]
MANTEKKSAYFRIAFFGVLLLQLFAINGFTQEKDTTKTSLTKKAWKLGMSYITTSAEDTVVNESSVGNLKSYEGRIIRNIHVNFFALEKSIYDSTRKTSRIIQNVSRALHYPTREKIIRNHLFVYPNQVFNPYRVADNERFLRDLDFILDSRIVVTPIGTDSVDLTVVTRDVFSLGLSFGGDFPTAPKVTLYDANLMGRGQRLEFTGLVEQGRSPVFGMNARYRKSSVLGSLASVEVGYSQINQGISIGNENEYAHYVRVDRPLVSPYSRLAGGIELSRNWSHNVYNKPDTSFLNYRYTVKDYWLGYNFGINREFSNRNRHFLGVRYFDGNYLRQPEQEEYKLNLSYNDLFGVLGEYTFYWQNFFKTRYVFGFGRTEDIPYGLTITATAGLTRQVGVERPYMATGWTHSFANRKGNFYAYGLEAGGYLRNNQMEDVLLKANANYVSRVFNLNRYKLRTLVAGAYTHLFNQNVFQLVPINSTEIRGFSADSVWGETKTFVRLETVLYTPWIAFGFRFAPFAGISRAQVYCKNCEDPNRVVWGISGGIRTRNENLIFGTIEFRLTYVPTNDATGSKFSFDFNQRLRVKNSRSFVRAPNLLRP